MERYRDHYRARNKTVSFWMSPEEYRNLQARVKITGLAKNEFMIRALLGHPIHIRAGKFESDRKMPYPCFWSAEHCWSKSEQSLKEK